MSHLEDTKEFIKALYQKHENPSKDRSDWWQQHWVTNSYPNHTSDGGKWLITLDKDKVDKAWEEIKKALDENKLGDIAKVSTAASRGFKGSDNHVICVYTYDSKDTEDLMRVRNALREMGYTEPLHYKRDKETLAGIYTNDEKEWFVTI